MRTAEPPRVLLGAEAPADDLCRPLFEAYLRVDRVAFAADPADPAAYRLAIVDAGQGADAAVRFVRRLRARLGDSFLPILYITDDASPAARLAGLEAGADAYLIRPVAAAEFLAQTRAFLRIKDEHDRLTEKSAEVHRINRRLQQAYQQIDGELELARRIQQSFLPRELPRVPGVRFAAHYEPHGHVGGDFYDVFRLDESRVGLYVADAMGHGVPAALLTIFVKTGVRVKEVTADGYRLVPPGEVLERLNSDLVAQALTDQPFITMAYAVYDHVERTLSFARAGHPHPLVVPAGGEPTLWQVEGSLLGVFETTFPVLTSPLRVGDKVLLYSDGIDAASFEGRPPGGTSLLACAARHRERPIEEFVPCLARDLFGPEGQPDDLTLLGLEIV